MSRFSAYFTDSSKTALVNIKQKSTTSNKKMKLVLGMSILKSQAINEQKAKLEALLTFIQNDVNVGIQKPEHIRLEEKPVIIISTLLQCFTLAGRLEIDEQLDLSDDAHLTKIKNESSDKFRVIFQNYCDKFLEHILKDKLKEQAQKNTDNWLLENKNKYLDGYKIINIDKYYKDPLYLTVFNYLKDLYISDNKFRLAIHADAQRFVISEIERSGNKIIEAIKARVWWHSTLHFLVENALFIMVAIREGMDALCYDGKEINSFATLKDVKRWNGLIEVINNWSSDELIDINPPDWLEIGYKKISQKNINEKIKVNAKPKSLPSSPKKLSPISLDFSAANSNNDNSDRERAYSEPHSFFASKDKQNAGKRNKSWPPSSNTSSDDEGDDITEITSLNLADKEARMIALVAEVYKNDLDTLVKFAAEYNEEKVLKVVAQVFKKDINKVSEFIKKSLEVKLQQNINGLDYHNKFIERQFNENTVSTELLNLKDKNSIDNIFTVNKVIEPKSNNQNLFKAICRIV